METTNLANDIAKSTDRTGPVIESVSNGQRHARVLQAWEAINSEREIEGVLAAVAKILVPVVPFMGVAIIAPQVLQGAPWALHVVGVPKRENECHSDFEQRVETAFPAPLPVPE